MTFLEKYELLKKSIPVPANVNRDSIDCAYANYANECKNCYYCFASYRLIDGLFTNNGWGDKLVDCSYVTESEKCYQCADCTKCYNSTYLLDCNSSNDCHFSALLNSCSDCFGCVGLTHKKYSVFNKQYAKEEYFIKVEELKKEKPEKILKQMIKLKQQIPHPSSQQFNSENCPYGDYIYYAKNCYWAFNSYFSENSGYIYFGGPMKNSWDMLQSGGDPTTKAYSVNCYQSINSDSNYECAFLKNSDYCRNCYSSEYLRNCSDCFGCVGLANKKFCVLNNQLTKDQYANALKEIKKELGWKMSLAFSDKKE